MAASSPMMNYDNVVVSSLIRHLAPSHLERLKTLLFTESGMTITGERTPQTTPYSRWEVIALQNLFAPIRRLPPEMLSEIFDHCCQDFSEDFNSYNDALKRPCEFHGRCPPTVMILGQVCSKWRGVVQRTPKLWTRLDICIGRRTRYCEYEFFIQELSTHNPSLPV
ncbi:hypothetical protein VKT23_009617 [Stygiomarasmius scandens]|uniref:F-box domain-containing protein n=1 Tax=Marasmiellus scandens TaxID=2682957 RepID=A0ABR1JIX4_9AGAR